MANIISTNSLRSIIIFSILLAFTEITKWGQSNWRSRQQDGLSTKSGFQRGQALQRGGGGIHFKEGRG